MAVFPVVKGLVLRATKVNSCGRPIAGAANRIVTDGWITAGLDPVMNDAEELEQRNAEGKICVSDRTPPERKWYTATLELCSVNTGLISMFNGWEQETDWDDNPVGFRDQAEVDSDFGVFLEIWTGGVAEDDCPIPTTDDIFTSVAASGKQYGYLGFAAKEFTLGGLSIAAQVATFTLTGITFAPPQWAKGVYNVRPIDADGTPGRLKNPMNAKQHFVMFRTPVPPPPPTEGGDPVALEIETLFAAPNYYYGGPASAPPADVAPEQDVTTKTATISGVPTGGSFTLTVNGEETANIAYNATGTTVQSAINALAGVSGAVVTGSAGGPYTIKIPGVGVVVTADDAGLTGGTSPAVTIS